VAPPHNRHVPNGQDDPDIGRPRWVVVRSRVSAILGRCEVDGLRLQFIVRAVVHEEPAYLLGLV
jgi:hypothetical protein